MNVTVTPTTLDVNVSATGPTVTTTPSVLTVTVVENGATVSISTAPIDVSTSVSEIQPISQSVLVTAVDVGVQGPPGVDGADNSTSQIEAAESISALKVVAVVDGLAYIASNANADHKGKIAGIAVSAVTTGNDVTIRHFGRMTDNAWNWTSKQLYVSTNGGLSQTPPVSGFVQSVARVEESDTIFVWLGDVIER